jgi:hypothetical protein
MSAIYKLTMDSLPTAQQTASQLPSALGPLTKVYEAALSEDNLPWVRIRLFLNVLWFEEDPRSFDELSTLLIRSLTGLHADALRRIAREIAFLYATKLGRGSPELAEKAAAALHRMTTVVDAPVLLELVPQADEALLHGIGRALGGLGEDALSGLLDASLRSADPTAKRRIASLITAPEFSRARVKTLVRIVRRGDPPHRREMLQVLVRTGDPRILSALFTKLDRRLSASPLMGDLVAACSEARMEEAVPYLAELRRKGIRSGWFRHQALRAAAAEALRRIGSPAALHVLQADGGH